MAHVFRYLGVDPVTVPTTRGPVEVTTGQAVDVPAQMIGPLRRGPWQPLPEGLPEDALVWPAPAPEE